MSTLVPIIAAFLKEYVRPRDIMAPHIECYQLLADILGLLSSGASYAVQHLDLLASYIQRHHELFVGLYPASAVKPKWHHMLHLPSLYRRLRKVISCFVTERKHKAVKGAALYVFRHLEHTVLADILNQQCEQILDGHSLFQRQFLAHPKTIDVFGHRLNRSSEAVLECGHIYTGDVIYVVGGVVARIMCFWQLAEHITAQCHVCEKVDECEYRDGTNVSFVSTDSILDAMSYRPRPDGSFMVLLPFAARFD